MDQIKVIGHLLPDTDSTCSPIVYAWFLNTQGQSAQAVISSSPNKEAQFVLNYFQVPTPEIISQLSEQDSLVLIDTNNPDELLSGWEKAKIVEIIDHHKLYGLKTTNIPSITIRPYGCVATVIWEKLTQQNVTFTKEMAGLLVSCILSDTLKFTSPTTTDIDKIAVSQLAPLAGISNLDDYTSQLFAAKSNLDGLTPKDILLTDAKDFQFATGKYKIAVLETTVPNQALSQKENLLNQMQQIKQSENLTGVFFFVVDILSSHSTLLTSGPNEQQLATKAFGTNPDADGFFKLPGIVSRKKQIVPQLEQAATTSA